MGGMLNTKTGDRRPKRPWYVHAWRWLFRLTLSGVLLFALTCALIYGSHRYTLATDANRPAADQRLGAVIVLGGGQARIGIISHASETRLRRALAAFGTGTTARLILSGGGRVPRDAPADKASTAALMRDLAVAAGVSPDRIIIEAASQSTFQNLARSLAIADRLGARPDGGDILVVTDSTHALRSRLLLRFFGRGQARVAAGNAFQAYPPRDRARTLMREAAALWLNLAKAAAWSALGLAGLPPEERLDWVR